MFQDCSALTSILIPNSVEKIGIWAFNGCESLSSIIIPNSVITIDNGAFEGCSSLTSIVIPKNVNTIGNYVFSNCRSLTIYVEHEYKPSGWSSIWNSDSRPVVWGYTGESGVTDDGFEYALLIQNNEKFITITKYLGTAIDLIIPDYIEIKGTSYKVKSISDEAFFS